MKYDLRVLILQAGFKNGADWAQEIGTTRQKCCWTSMSYISLNWRQSSYTFGMSLTAAFPKK